MYKVKAIVVFEDDSMEIKSFNFWGEATAWVEYLANENESLPAEVKMTIVR